MSKLNSNQKQALKQTVVQATAIILLFLAILWIIIGPKIVVSPTLKYYGLSENDFRATGQIGDTIGGITAPIIGLVSAILIYLSFSAQVKANMIIQQESNFKYILDEFEKVKSSFKRVKYSYTGDEYMVESKPSAGHLAMERMVKDVYERQNILASQSFYVNDSLTKADYIFQGYSIFIEEVLSLNLSIEQREIVQKKIWLFHDENIKKYLSMIKSWQITKPDKEIFEEREYDNRFRAFSLHYKTQSITSSIDSFQKSFKSV